MQPYDYACMYLGWIVAAFLLGIVVTILVRTKP